MQIHELPATTTFDDSTVLAVENVSGTTNVTSKVTLFLYSMHLEVLHLLHMYTS